MGSGTMSSVFHCEDGSPAGVVFGAFDGIRDWKVNAFTVTTDIIEQELVSAHEERHLRLQQGTPYGAALAVLGAAVRSGAYPVSSWAADVDRVRTTHEVYATFMSVAHVDGGLDVLTGNLRYLEYWRTGNVIFRAFEAAPEPLMLMEFLFHQIMSPQPVGATSDSRFMEPAVALVRGEKPDDRLQRVMLLLADDRGFVDAVVEAVRVGDEVDDNLTRLAAVLTNGGVATMDAVLQEQVSRQMVNAFNAGDHDHIGALTLRSRRTSLEDRLDYLARETVHLHHKRLPVLVGHRSFPPGINPYVLLKRDGDRIGSHLWTVLISGAELQRQFDGDVDADEIYFGFLSCDRREPPGIAYLLPVTDSPKDATLGLAELGLRTLTMTTLLTYARVARRVEFSDTEPLFVLVDAAVRPLLVGLRDKGLVEWTTVAVTGDRLLHAVLLTAGNQQLHFVWIGTIYALKPLLEWLRREADIFQFVGEDYPDVSGETFALLRHVVGTFASLGPR